VDVQRRLVTAPQGTTWRFIIGDYAQRLLMEGIDEIDAGVAASPRISTFAKDYTARKPWLAVGTGMDA
jgi:3-isopropylmalate dehydratase small subunit